jgi:hypothetical protein
VKPSKITGAEAPPQSPRPEEKACSGLPTDLHPVPAGIVGTRIDPANRCLMVDYEPDRISEGSVREVAAQLGSEAQRRFNKCLMHLGGRACEACALNLERKAQRIEGVRREEAGMVVRQLKDLGVQRVVMVTGDNLRHIPFALALSRRARTVIWQNLAIAVSVMVTLVISALGFALPLPLGVVGHEGSTVLVCLNGLRLLAFRRRG